MKCKRDIRGCPAAHPYQPSFLLEWSGEERQEVRNVRVESPLVNSRKSSRDQAHAIGQLEGQPEGHCVISVCAHSNGYQPLTGNVAAGKRNVHRSCFDDLKHAHSVHSERQQVAVLTYNKIHPSACDIKREYRLLLIED
jgi:hypothetical protein